ncbi:MULTISPECIES: RPA12/RPB9/RPC11 RNA polymerase family protein [Metallosphaera]|uniref:DNA-directed RNA polymerase, subunit M n=4 Tax=Sulfolobaceae TaxID=118883 RepID=A4YI43_METS5|nr:MULTISPECIES: RPA12/RPB9/RPC11 RNA polymerase family protein [Metallosphaera]ABP96095.1 DNA-directed RNA polymerase, subunit M [Metallosphaera sedula DSM 5348]AIM28079.1 DNA-directed RNA polymerase, subunit M [Metallosphaera sedula]AKV74906.1 DNA-directed RNA polymerase subunit M [Metallosphaera sedula]AKV77144.1 DNA-directed RNA polymerase subunit M [Metallosphaera sedula]AKV79394.1 DNA-directed RNA polymerase subunit M [Metallosphaera sedula]
MKFCPKDGGIMLPAKKGDKEILRCKKCGYEEPLDKKTRKAYQIKEDKSKSGKVLTTSIVSEKEGRRREDDEWEQEREEYYKEIGLDLLRDELEGSEEHEEE